MQYVHRWIFMALSLGLTGIGCASTPLLPPPQVDPESTEPVPTPPEVFTPKVFAHTLLISVDGLRSDVLTLADPQRFPALRTLLNDAGTLQARCDPDAVLTLPNHTGMLTGRLMNGDTGHGWMNNTTPPAGVTLHSNHSDSYIAGVFDKAHDAGSYTTLISGKEKFRLFDLSWDATHGQVKDNDAELTRDKLDEFHFLETTDQITATAITGLTAGRSSSTTFVHFAETDQIGHLHDWAMATDSEYFKAVDRVDAAIGKLLSTITETEALKGKTAILLTSDHGGGVPEKGHYEPRSPANFVIPFLVWTGGHGQALELYTINETTRKQPGPTHPKPNAEAQPPIRNADIGNHALQLMGIGPIPGSTVNRKQDLKVSP